LYAGIFIKVNGIRIAAPVGGVGVSVAHGINIALLFIQGDMNCSGAHFDSDGGVKYTDSCLEWLEEPVSVRENAKLPLADTKTNASMDVLLGRLRPRVTLCLKNPSERDDRCKAVGYDPSENVVQQSVMYFVIHGIENG
jgi:hypothetical protein